MENFRHVSTEKVFLENSIDNFYKEKFSFLWKAERNNPDANEKLFSGRDHLEN